MTKVLYFPPAYVSKQPVLLDLPDTAAAAIVSSGAGAYPVPMPLDRLPLVPAPTPPMTGSIGGVAINTLATSGPEAGMRLVYGDDFDGQLDMMGPAPAQRFGRWCPTRGNYLIYDPGQQPRASTGLGGVDADPYWTGHLDSNRGEPIASLSDIIVQSGGKLSLRQRDMVAGEEKHVPFANQNTMSSMAHGAFDVMVTAPFVYKWEEQRFANYRDHMTTWFMNYMGFTRGDIEVDFEAASKKNGTGDGRQLEFNINAWDGVERSETDSAGSAAVTVDWATPKTMAFHADAQGIVNFYMEGQLAYQYARKPEKVLAQPYHPVFSNHMYNVPRPTGLSRLEYGYIALYVPNKHYVPQVAPLLIQVASGESKTVVLPTQLALWGEAVTEKIEACMVEPNEPGGTTSGQFYVDLPPGVTFNSSTRELAINVTTPGRLNIGMYVIRAGCSCKVFRIAIEVGPVINIANINVTKGKPFSLDLYKLVDCGILVTDGVKRTKKITVEGLPGDLPYDDGTGFISGTTNATEGISQVTITGTNSGGQKATRTANLNVSAAGEYAYQSLAGIVARFDGSRAASFAAASGDFTALGNAVAGGGDLARATTLSTSPTRVENQLNGLAVMRFTKTAEGGSVVESAQNSAQVPIPAAAALTGSNTAFTQVWLVKFDAGSGTCVLGGPSEQVSSSAARNATIVKRDPATSDSSFRYGATTATSADVNIGKLAEGVWHFIVARHNGDGTSDVWVNDTQVVTKAAHTSSSAWAGTARYSLGNCQGSTGNSTRYPNTALAGYIAENVFYASAHTDAEVLQIRTDFKTKWKYHV